MKKIPSIKELRPICQPNYKFEKTIFLVYIFRSFSIYITRFFLFLGVSANATSILSMFFGLLGSIVLLSFNNNNLFLSSIFLFFHTILDFVDGEVARYNSDGTPTGKYLDDVNHSINVPLLILFLSFGIFQISNNILIFFLGALAAVCEAVGHNVDWGYSSRIVLQELKKKKDKEKIILYTKDNRTNLFELFSIFIDKILNIHPIFKKLYDKIWIENRIVNYVMFTGLITPFFSLFETSGLELKFLTLVIYFYGINRPIVMFQFYFQKIFLSGKKIEKVIDDF